MVAAVVSLGVACYAKQQHDADAAAAKQQHDYDLQLKSAEASSAQKYQSDQAQSLSQQHIRDQQQQLLLVISPKVTGETGTTKNCDLAIGLWSTMYPGEAAAVLANACASNSSSKSVQEPPPDAPREFGVVVGSDTDQGDVY